MLLFLFILCFSNTSLGEILAQRKFGAKWRPRQINIFPLCAKLNPGQILFYF